MSETAGAGPLRLTASFEGTGGKPVLVLGNSLGTSRAVWEPQLPALAAHFRLLRYELPGHGIQPPPGQGQSPGAAPGPCSVAGLGRAVLDLLDSHGIDRACYCGISLGGMAGMWLAAHAPARIAALGLCCTSAYLPPASGWLDRAALVRSAGMTAVSGQSIGRWFTPPFIRSSPEVVAGVAAALERIDPEGYAGCCEAIAGMDLRGDLAAITAPVLVIAADQDQATPPAHGALIARGISGGRLVVIRGAAHLANVQASGPVTSALLAHLRAAARR